MCIIVVDLEVLQSLGELYHGVENTAPGLLPLMKLVSEHIDTTHFELPSPMRPKYDDIQIELSDESIYPVQKSSTSNSKISINIKQF